MGEIIQHRSDGACWTMESVNPRMLSENRRMYACRHVYCPLSGRNSPMNHRVMMKKTSSKSSLTSWWNDPELKRQRRIASYKYYSAEANVKRSFKKGIRWLGNKCSMIIRRF